MVNGRTEDLTWGPGQGDDVWERLEWGRADQEDADATVLMWGQTTESR